MCLPLTPSGDGSTYGVTTTGTSSTRIAIASAPTNADVAQWKERQPTKLGPVEVRILSSAPSSWISSERGDFRVRVPGWAQCGSRL